LILLNSAHPTPDYIFYTHLHCNKEYTLLLEPRNSFRLRLLVAPSGHTGNRQWIIIFFEGYGLRILRYLILLNSAHPTPNHLFIHTSIATKNIPSFWSGGIHSDYGYLLGIGTVAPSLMTLLDETTTPLQGFQLLWKLTAGIAYPALHMLPLQSRQSTSNIYNLLTKSSCGRRSSLYEVRGQQNEKEATSFL